MPYTPWDEETNNGWIPKLDYPNRPLSGPVSWPPQAPTVPMTPPFFPGPMAGPVAAPSAPPPMAGPAPLSGLDKLAGLTANAPLRSDPQYQPSKTRQILGTIAGAGLGAAAGYVNAAGRTKVPQIGAEVADTIVNSKYNQAERDFQDQMKAATGQATVEQAKAASTQKAAESAAKIAAANAKANRQVEPKLPTTFEAELVAQLHDPKISQEDKAAITAKLEGIKNKTADDITVTPEMASKYAQYGWTAGMKIDPNRVTQLIGLEEMAGRAKEAAELRKTVTDQSDARMREIAAENRASREAINAQNVANSRENAAANRATQLAIAGMRQGTGSGLSSDAEGVKSGNINYWGLGQKERAAVRRALGPSFVEPVKTTSGQVDKNSAGESALGGIGDLQRYIDENKANIGPFVGRAAIIPGTKAHEIRARMDLQKQRIGKFLEGGVLRKEDEEKYKKIIGQVTDVPEQAIKQLDFVAEELTRDLAAAKAQRQQSGRVPQTAPATASTKPAAPNASPTSLTVDQAKEYLKRAGGDKEKARKLASADGHTF
jgi:hypothetical protein